MRRYFYLIIALGFLHNTALQAAEKDSISATVVMQVNGANITIQEGSSLQIDGDIVLDQFDEAINSQLRLNGSLYVKRDFWSNVTTPFLSTEGWVIMNGDEEQYFGGNNEEQLRVEKLRIEGDNLVNLSRDVRILQDLNMSKGYLELQDKNLTINANARISGNIGDESFISTTGAGLVVKRHNGTSKYTFPIGSVNDNAIYSPVTITFDDGEFNSHSLIMAGVKPQKHTINYNTKNSIRRNWNVFTSDIKDASYDLTFSYKATDIEGEEQKLHGMRVYEIQGNYWPDFHHKVDQSEHSFNINTEQLGEFTAGDPSSNAFSDVIPFPNPSNGEFTLRVLIPTAEPALIRFYNMDGQTILESTVIQADNFFNLSSYPKGIYFIKIFFDYKIVSRKIVIS